MELKNNNNKKKKVTIQLQQLEFVKIKGTVGDRN